LLLQQFENVIGAQAVCQSLLNPILLLEDDVEVAPARRNAIALAD
jgi:hypothetical protein